MRIDATYWNQTCTNTNFSLELVIQCSEIVGSASVQFICAEHCRSISIVCWEATAEIIFLLYMSDYCTFADYIDVVWRFVLISLSNIHARHCIFLSPGLLVKKLCCNEGVGMANSLFGQIMLLSCIELWIFSAIVSLEYVSNVTSEHVPWILCHVFPHKLHATQIIWYELL